MSNKKNMKVKKRFLYKVVGVEKKKFNFFFVGGGGGQNQNEKKCEVKSK